MTALASLTIVAQEVIWRLSPLAVVILSLLLIALFVWLDRRKRPARFEAVAPRASTSPRVEPAPAISLTEPAIPAPVPSITLADAAQAPVAIEPPEPVQAEVQAEATRSADIELVEQPAAEVPADDLEIIEGIGPKISGVLQQAGVRTFAQLAQMAPAQITEILQSAGLRLADPRSWPEQARLAAAGDVAGLQDLQSHLKAGRVM